MQEPGSGSSLGGGEACGVASRWTTQDVWASKRAFFMAAMHTHLSLQHGFNHLDRKTSNLKPGLKMLCFSC